MGSASVMGPGRVRAGSGLGSAGDLEVVELLALFLETAVMAEITTLADILQTLLAAVLSEENMEARGLTEACLPTITDMEVLLELAAELMEMTAYSLITHKKVGKV